MRDKRFVAEHRGGPLTREQHQQLMKWAIECAEHVLPLLTEPVDERISNALTIAGEWALGQAATAKAMKASLAAHAAAREATSEVARSVARAAGQCVATAHMSDHSLGAALYALQATNRAGKSVATERHWQTKKMQQLLPPEIVALVTQRMEEKGQGFKL